MIFYRNLLIVFITIFILSCKKVEKSSKSTVDSAIKTVKVIKANKQEELDYYQINDNDVTELDINAFSINEEKKYADLFLKQITNDLGFSVNSIFAYYESGSYDEYLITLDNKNNLISKLLVKYNSAPDGNVRKYEYTNFKLKKSLDLEVYKINVIEDLETQKIIKKDTIKKIYKINDIGEIVRTGTN